jgi:ferredoxin
MGMNGRPDHRGSRRDLPGAARSAPPEPHRLPTSSPAHGRRTASGRKATGRTNSRGHLDNSRSRVLASGRRFSTAQCGACLNTCPVFQQIKAPAGSVIPTDRIGAPPAMHSMDKFDERRRWRCGACRTCVGPHRYSRMLLELRGRAWQVAALGHSRHEGIRVRRDPSAVFRAAGAVAARRARSRATDGSVACRGICRHGRHGTSCTRALVVQERWKKKKPS